MKKIRLSDHDLRALENLFLQHFLPGDKLWVFGSRVNLSKKGGDIDLYIETHAKSVEDAIKMRGNFLWDLEQKIGEQKIDIVLNILKDTCHLPIYQVALNEGVRVV